MEALPWKEKPFIYDQFSHNIRGIKAFEKVGFKKEGVIRESLYFNNRYSDGIIMGMLRSEYVERKKNHVSNDSPKNWTTNP